MRDTVLYRASSLFIELNYASCFAVVEHLFVLVFLGMSSGWGIGGIHLTENFLSW